MQAPNIHGSETEYQRAQRLKQEKDDAEQRRRKATFTIELEWFGKRSDVRSLLDYLNRSVQLRFHDDTLSFKAIHAGEHGTLKFVSDHVISTEQAEEQAQRVIGDQGEVGFISVPFLSEPQMVGGGEIQVADTVADRLARVCIQRGEQGLKTVWEFDGERCVINGSVAVSRADGEEALELYNEHFGVGGSPADSVPLNLGGACRLCGRSDGGHHSFCRFS